MAERNKAKSENWPLKRSRPIAKDRNSWVWYYLVKGLRAHKVEKAEK